MLELVDVGPRALSAYRSLQDECTRLAPTNAVGLSSRFGVHQVCCVRTRCHGEFPKETTCGQDTALTWVGCGFGGL